MKKWWVWALAALVIALLWTVFAPGGLDPADQEPAIVDSAPTKTASNQEKPKVRVASEFYEPGASDLPPVDEAPAAKIEEVYGLLDPDFHVKVRCRVPEGFGDGTYQQMPDEVVRYIWVEDGVLTAFVHTQTATVFLSDHLVTAGTLEWEQAKAGRWNNCSVRLPEMVTVSGVVRSAEGSPVPDFSLGTCEHGEFAMTDERGAFSFEAAKNFKCYLTAVMQTETSLGRGPSVLVDTSSDVSEVVVVLPSESEMMTGPAIEKAADGLAYMAVMQLGAETQKPSPAAAVLSNSDLSEEGAAILERWVSDEKRKLDAMKAQAEAAAQGGAFEDRKQAVADALFQTYY